jgi:DNA-binding transcriptional ArsR family regulator
MSQGASREATRGRGAESGRDESLGEAAEILKALAHPVRLRIIQLLAKGELCVKSLEQVLGIPQPSVSQHLSRLRYAGLIESERRGHLVCYRLVRGTARSVVEAALGTGQAAKARER